MWATLAYARLGDVDRAAGLFALLNPINHARTPAEARRYKVEPYVVAADVYSEHPHVGRGGWTWYTGAAGWMYRAGLEGILGLRRKGATLVVEPRLPANWPGYRLVVQVSETRYEIRVERGVATGGSAFDALLDGVAVDGSAGQVELPLDGTDHDLRVVLARSAT